MSVLSKLTSIEMNGVYVDKAAKLTTFIHSSGNYPQISYNFYPKI